MSTSDVSKLLPAPAQAKTQVKLQASALNPQSPGSLLPKGQLTREGESVNRAHGNLRTPCFPPAKPPAFAYPPLFYRSLLRKVWMVSPAQRSQPSRRRNRATHLPPAQMQDCHQAPRPTLSECGWGSGCAWATRGWPGPLTRIPVSEWPVSKTNGIYKAESGRRFLSNNSVTRGPHGAQVPATSR